MVKVKIVERAISVIEYYKSLHWFFAYTLEKKCFSILLKRLRLVFDISYCDVIYYVIFFICSLYVIKAISPLFAWCSSYVFQLWYSVHDFTYEYIKEEREGWGNNYFACMILLTNLFNWHFVWTLTSDHFKVKFVAAQRTTILQICL